MLGTPYMGYSRMEILQRISGTQTSEKGGYSFTGNSTVSDKILLPLWFAHYPYINVYSFSREDVDVVAFLSQYFEANKKRINIVARLEVAAESPLSFTKAPATICRSRRVGATTLSQ
jgi:hypothetical protein